MQFIYKHSRLISLFFNICFIQYISKRSMECINFVINGFVDKLNQILNYIIVCKNKIYKICETNIKYPSICYLIKI